MENAPISNRSATILLVDDDDVDVIAVKRAFKQLKIANPIIRARDGVEALEMLRTGKVPQPYIILLDINMPRMTGIEMLTELRNDPTISTSVVFVLTTSDDDEDKLAAYRKHIAGYIIKQQVGDGFMQAVTMLDHYWRVVELPILDKGVSS